MHRPEGPKERRPRDRWYLTGRTAVLGTMAACGGLAALNPSLEVSLLERVVLIVLGAGGVALLIASMSAIVDRW